MQLFQVVMFLLLVLPVVWLFQRHDAPLFHDFQVAPLAHAFLDAPIACDFCQTPSYLWLLCDVPIPLTSSPMAPSHDVHLTCAS